MGVDRDRGWGLRDSVIATGLVLGLVFVLIELTGSDINRQASQTLGTALAVVLFTVFALFVALAILAIVDGGVDISGRVYAIVATVYVAAAAVLLVLRLLPLGDEAPAPR